MSRKNRRENKFVKWTEIENFIANMSTKIPFKINHINAMREANFHKWNKYTLEELIKEIKKKYGIS